VAARASLDPAAALANIGALYPECVRFAFQRGDAVFLGASPERLVLKHGLAVEADALAGTAPRRAEGDARAAAALLESDKDRREHRVVVEAIEAALSPLAKELNVPGAPVVRTLRNVHHLWTPITATLARPRHVLDLVRILHPTPAVCGTPREAAIRWIAAHEPEARGWYAGAVGWFDAEGDGAFSVAIRSGVLARREAWLYAGAGIVEGSDASAEYAETRTKQAPMLAALGLVP
jgi:menaquinone-specific isochorismate synthase